MRKWWSKICLLISVVCLSCETLSDIELEAGSGDIVMTSFVYADSVVTVNLYGTVTVSDTGKMSQLNNAKVELKVGNRIYTEYLSREGYKVDFGSVRLMSGDDIEITATVDDKVVEATTYIPTFPAEISVDTIRNLDYGLMYFFVEMYDSITTPDYYQLVVRRSYVAADGKLVTENMECNYYDYLFFHASMGITQQVTGLFTDEIINGQKYKLKVSVGLDDIWKNVPSESSVTVEILLYHHTGDYYQYAGSVSGMDAYLLLPVFMSPVVHTNVKGGLGIVSGMSSTKLEIVITK